MVAGREPFSADRFQMVAGGLATASCDILGLGFLFAAYKFTLNYHAIGVYIGVQAFFGSELWWLLVLLPFATYNYTLGHCDIDVDLNISGVQAIFGSELLSLLVLPFATNHYTLDHCYIGVDDYNISGVQAIFGFGPCWFIEGLLLATCKFNPGYYGYYWFTSGYGDIGIFGIIYTSAQCEAYSTQCRGCDLPCETTI